MTRLKIAALALAGALAAPGVQAACPPAAAIEALANAWLARRPAQSYAGTLSLEDALCAQRGLVQRLIPTLGNPVGYKVGLSSVPMQRAFRTNAPVRGVLLERMILPDGSRVPVNFGARPLFEADLLVRISNEAVNDARTPQDVARAIDLLIPFIELSDSVLALDQPVDANMLVAVNAGARLGVQGRPIPARVDEAFVAALADMTVVVTDLQRGELDRAQGRAVLDHPFNAVIWLAGSLARTGARLAIGDLVSVGSFSRQLPVRPDMTVRVSYSGLPGTPETAVAVTFRPQ